MKSIHRIFKNDLYTIRLHVEYNFGQAIIYFNDERVITISRTYSYVSIRYKDDYTSFKIESNKSINREIRSRILNEILNYE